MPGIDTLAYLLFNIVKVFKQIFSLEENIENLFNGGTLRQQFDFSKP